MTTFVTSSGEVRDKLRRRSQFCRRPDWTSYLVHTLLYTSSLFTVNVLHRSEKDASILFSFLSA